MFLKHLPGGAQATADEIRPIVSISVISRSGQCGRSGRASVFVLFEGGETGRLCPRYTWGRRSCTNGVSTMLLILERQGLGGRIPRVRGSGLWDQVSAITVQVKLGRQTALQ